MSLEYLTKADITKFINRLTRVDARVTKGFKELGIDVASISVSPVPDMDIVKMHQTSANNLKRLETKLVKGFLSLGADVTNKPAITVNDDEGTIIVSTLNVTIRDLTEATTQYTGRRFEIIHEGKIYGVFIANTYGEQQ